MESVAYTLIGWNTSIVQQVAMVLSYFYMFVARYGFSFLVAVTADIIWDMMSSGFLHEISNLTYRRYAPVRNAMLRLLHLKDVVEELKWFPPTQGLWVTTLDDGMLIACDKEAAPNPVLTAHVFIYRKQSFVLHLMGLSFRILVIQLVWKI